jgi:hypothetical protein
VPGSKSHREELKTRWGERVQLAHADYEQARDAVRDALEKFRNTSVPTADALLMLKEAAELERVSLLEYMRVLRILHDLVVDDKMPPDD